MHSVSFCLIILTGFLTEVQLDVGKRSSVSVLTRWRLLMPLLTAAGEPQGDLGYPSCSNCSDAEEGCVYSRVRKRPGPSKGSRRGTKRPQKVDRSPKMGEPALDWWTTSLGFLTLHTDCTTGQSTVMMPITPQLTIDEAKTLTLHCSLLLPTQAFEL